MLGQATDWIGLDWEMLSSTDDLDLLEISWAGARLEIQLALDN